MKVAFPEAEIPVVQLSLIEGLDANEHLRMGKALAQLRDENVLIIGTGNTFHNLQVIRAAMHGSAPGARERAAEFDDWLQAAVTGDPTARDEQLRRWQKAPFARFAQPREEHLLSLMVVAGAAGADRGLTTWSGTLAGLRGSGFRFG
jgi:aromatic ring-opening dioxygenase catalytic subunit (LigB family)